MEKGGALFDAPPFARVCAYQPSQPSHQFLVTQNLITKMYVGHEQMVWIMIYSPTVGCRRLYYVHISGCIPGCSDYWANNRSQAPLWWRLATTPPRDFAATDSINGKWVGDIGLNRLPSQQMRTPSLSDGEPIIDSPGHAVVAGEGVAPLPESGGLGCRPPAVSPGP